MRNFLYILIICLASAAYISAVWQMLYGSYRPSFFSRGVWFLLGLNSFAGVLLGDGSQSSVILAFILVLGNAAIFLFSYKRGTRVFGNVEKVSLALLIVSGIVLVVYNEPFIALAMSLTAHFIGGIPTIWRAIQNPASEQVYHWYFFTAASILTIIVSEQRTIATILFPAYFITLNGFIILLVNRKLPSKVFAKLTYEAS